jgi:hypothetical protein
MTCTNWAAWVEVIGTWFGAIATFLAVVAALAIAVLGEPIARWLWGPKLELKLHDREGDLFGPGENGRIARYYHVKITNKGHMAAERVRVRIERIDRRQPDGRVVASEDICDSCATPVGLQPSVAA